MDQNKELEKRTEYLLCSSVNTLENEDKLDYIDDAIKSKPNDHIVRMYAAELNFHSEEGSILVAYSHAIKALTQCGLEERIDNDSLSDLERDKAKKDKEQIIDLTKLIYKSLMDNEEDSNTFKEIFDINNREPKVLKYGAIVLGHILLATQQGDKYFSQEMYPEAKERYQEAIITTCNPNLKDEHLEVNLLLGRKLTLCDLKLENYKDIKKKLNGIMDNKFLSVEERLFWESLQGLVKKKDRGKNK